MPGSLLGGFNGFAPYLGANRLPGLFLLPSDFLHRPAASADKPVMDRTPGQDRRTAPRWQCHETARLILLKEFGPMESAAVEVLEYSSGGMRVALPLPVQPGAAVRVEFKDLLLLGEVVHTSPQPAEGLEMQWTCGIRFEQGIFGVAGLQRLMAALAGERPPSTPAGSSPAAHSSTTGL